MRSEGLQIVLNNYNIKDQEEFDRDKIRDYFNVAIKECVYISTRTLTGDFLCYLGYSVQNTKGDRNFIKELRRVLSHCFKPHLIRFVKEGKLIKYSKFLYKVVK